MSASILEDRAGYRALKSSQTADLGTSAWLKGLLRTLLASLRQALVRIDRVLAKSRYWKRHREHALSKEPLKVLNRLLDGGEHSFENGISAAQYQSVPPRAIWTIWRRRVICNACPAADAARLIESPARKSRSAGRIAAREESQRGAVALPGRARA